MTDKFTMYHKASPVTGTVEELSAYMLSEKSKVDRHFYRADGPLDKPYGSVAPDGIVRAFRNTSIILYAPPKAAALPELIEDVARARLALQIAQQARDAYVIARSPHKVGDTFSAGDLYWKVESVAAYEDMYGQFHVKIMAHKLLSMDPESQTAAWSSSLMPHLYVVDHGAVRGARAG